MPLGSHILLVPKFPLDIVVYQLLRWRHTALRCPVAACSVSLDCIGVHICADYYCGANARTGQKQIRAHTQREWTDNKVYVCGRWECIMRCFVFMMRTKNSWYPDGLRALSGLCALICEPVFRIRHARAMQVTVSCSSC